MAKPANVRIPESKTNARFRKRGLACWLTVSILIALGCNPSVADEALRRSSSWQMVPAETMRQQLRGDLDLLGIAPDKIDQAGDTFLELVETDDADPLDAFLSVVSELAPALQNFVSLADTNIVDAAAAMDPSAPGYADLNSLPETTRMNTRVWIGRQLVRQRLFDEALPVLAEVNPLKATVPAAAMFYRGACYHAMLMKTEALGDLRKLLENEDEIPVRFARTAALMIADIKPLKEDSLDEISRLMTDVTRRLDLGRAGEKVEKRQQEIIDKLTKLIEKAEQQQKQQQQQAGAGGGSAQGGDPGGGMKDSQAAGGQMGNGDVDRKEYDDGPAWGNLPPAERQQTIQQISRDLPTHYREAIEAYFRKMATDDAG